MTIKNSNYLKISISTHNFKEERRIIVYQEVLMNHNNVSHTVRKVTKIINFQMKSKKQFQ